MRDLMAGFLFPEAITVAKGWAHARKQDMLYLQLGFNGE